MQNTNRIKKLKCKICFKKFKGYQNKKFCDCCRKRRATLYSRHWARKHYDREKSVEACKRYQKKYREKYLAYRRMWSKKNRQKIRDYNKKLREEDLKNNPYKVHLRQSYNRCNSKTSRYHKRGIKCLLTIKNVKFLWERDKAYLLFYPSLDRIDGKKNYTLTNCRFIECYKNCNRNNPI